MLIAIDTHPHRTIDVHRIGLGDLRWALARGWADFLNLQGISAVAALLYPAAGLMIFFAVQRAALAPLLFPIFAGAALVGPALSIGFYEIARRRKRGEPIDHRTFFAPYCSSQLGRLLPVALMLATLFALWIASATVLHKASLGSMSARPAADFIRTVLGTREGWLLILSGNLIGGAFAALALAIGLVSVPMLVDRPVGTREALATSFLAIRRNPGPVLAWGGIVATLSLLGGLFLFAGLAVSFPVLGYATWHLYTRLVSR